MAAAILLVATLLATLLAPLVEITMVIVAVALRVAPGATTATPGYFISQICNGLIIQVAPANVMQHSAPRTVAPLVGRQPIRIPALTEVAVVALQTTLIALEMVPAGLQGRIPEKRPTKRVRVPSPIVVPPQRGVRTLGMTIL